MNINVLIAEDNILIAEHISNVLQDNNMKIFGIFKTKNDAIKAIEKAQPDIALLDINLGNKYDGIEIGEYIISNYKFPIVYITAHSEKSIVQKALKTEPAGYILKPFKDEDLTLAVQIALEKFRYIKEDSFINIKEKYENIKLFCDDILYIKSDNYYIEIYTKNKKYIERSTLKTIILSLDNSKFVKVHRSYLVNINKITKYSANKIFINEIEIPISRYFVKNIRMILNKK